MDSLIQLNGNKAVMVLPNGAEQVVLDMDEIYHIDKRQHEVATVNLHRAPELLTTFNRGFIAAREAAIKVQGLIDAAKKAERTRAAIVVLDEVPKILVQKGLATTRSPGGSEDLRKAVLHQDPEYVACLDRISMLEAAKAFLELKAKGFENSYTSVKKIFGGEPSWQQNYRNPNLSAGAALPEGIQAGDVVTPTPRPVYPPEDPRSRFGQSK